MGAYINVKVTVVEADEAESTYGFSGEVADHKDVLRSLVYAIERQRSMPVEGDQ